MTPNQPYLLRAYYEWIVDNECTPHIAVDALVDGVDVPREHIKDGQIVLNISPSACADLQITDDWTMFNARFSGISRRLAFPTHAVLAIFARENGAGTMFMQQDIAPTSQPEVESTDTGSSQSNKTTLESVAGTGSDVGSDTVSKPSLESQEEVSETSPKNGKKGKPTLTVVK